jgi:site-specific DNA-methyltransferase (adenine-specific)/adenine-specific DNA-methyltransferase
MAKTDLAYDLSDAERRHLIMLLQQGKPLPEKYRFILFEDKREVELAWNGKTRNVCTTVLPFQSLEQIGEPRTETQLQEELFDRGGRQLRAGPTSDLGRQPAVCEARSPTASTAFGARRPPCRRERAQRRSAQWSGPARLERLSSDQLRKTAQRRHGRRRRGGVRLCTANRPRRGDAARQAGLGGA